MVGGGGIKMAVVNTLSGIVGAMKQSMVMVRHLGSCRGRRLPYNWGEPERAPQLGDQRRLCLSSYVLP